ncbi:MAG: amidohydrolase family protein, partial [Pseudomonadota bacterium]
MSNVTVFTAKKVLTMDPSVPEATHIAVREGRILAVGDASCGDQWGTVTRDERLADSVLMPGLVEGHAHLMAGAMWRYAYAGYHDRTDPQGKLWKGLTTLDEVIAGMKDYAATLAPGEPLVGWGFDPIFLQDERLSRRHLDAIDADRPIAIMFSNFHLMCVNSASLAAAGYDAGTNAEGVVKGPDGVPTGELQEMAAMFPVMRRLGIDFRGLSQTEDAIRTYGDVAKRVGVTTITDLFSSAEDADVDVMTEVTNDPAFPLRLVPALGTVAEPEAMAQKALSFAARSTDKLRLGAVKLMTDGSIQGWTARTRWPGYVGGQANGIWNTAPEMIHKIALT